MEKAANPFPWFEINTSNQAECKEFYTSLFGWTTSGFDMGPHGTYTMFHMPGSEQPFGGIVELNEEMMPGVPPHWAVYIHCDDVDAHCERVKSMGGSVMVEPFDIPDIGRTALVRDPHGAAFYLFTPPACS